MISFIYTHNDSRRHDLWNSINSLSASCNPPWILAKNFNCILFSNEKAGDNPIPYSRLSYFRDCIENAKFHDLVNHGLFFTWSNMQHDNPICGKLDIVMCNFYWLNEFPDSIYKFKPPFSSDYSLLIISFKADIKIIAQF